MKTLDEIQELHKAWGYKNFGNQSAIIIGLGIAEEAGEICHHILKREQKIRLNENHDAGIENGIGDTVMYLMHLCNIENLKLSEVINKVWTEIEQRDWKKHNHTGIDEKSS